MPVPATGLADVFARDPNPLELGGPGDHLLEQRAVAAVEIRSLLVDLLGVGDPRGERIADSLQLAKPDHPRLASASRNLELELQAREGIREESCQLVLQAADLAPQLSACEALIASHPKRCESVSFEQIRHKPFRV